ncbi:MFS transporter [Actinoallomurus purpureus]|uniref:MFS transporter n=1 Tax=Actinoallomurus purpureus TaxID=478114 RepID=UPI002092A0C3|nr:MFS transporter [Actinoallomurus purpureus]MCO6007735.1 MFS transporter [Actinoallomurus purpureus]
MIVRVTNRLATETLAFAIPLLIFNATHSMAWSGLVLALEWTPRLIGIPIAGPLVDRFGSRTCLLAAEAVRTVLLTCALIGIVTRPDAWALLVALAFAAGTFGQASYIAVEKLGVEINGSKSMAWMQSTQAGIDQMALVAGPFVAGVLAGQGDVWVLSAVLALVLISGGLCRRLPERPSGMRARRSTWAELTAGLRGVMRYRALIHIVLATAAFNLLAATILGITPAVVEDRFGRPTSYASIVWTLGATASLAVIIVMTRVASRMGILKIGLFSGLIACLAAVGAGMASGFAIYLVWTCLFLASEGAFACFLRIARARVIPVEDFGVTVSAVVLLVAIPYPIAGVLVAATPLRDVPVLLTVCSIACLAITVFSFSRLRRHSLAAP